MTLGNISPTTMFIEIVKNAAAYKFSRKKISFQESRNVIISNSFL